ncbi:hypothetical protein JW962_00025 [Candidatus Dojkabacteria bacterium]|nr:hypothetical protein [Candidatus Dojkabacteria bacterium]
MKLNWQKIKPILLYGSISVLTLSILGVAVYVATGHELPFLGKKEPSKEETNEDVVTYNIEHFTCSDVYGTGWYLDLAVPEGATVTQENFCNYTISYESAILTIGQSYGEAYPSNVDEGFTVLEGSLIRTKMVENDNPSDPKYKYQAWYKRLLPESECVPNELFPEIRAPCSSGGPEFAPVGGAYVSFSSVSDIDDTLSVIDQIILRTEGGGIQSNGEIQLDQITNLYTVMGGYHGSNKEFIDFYTCNYELSYCNHYLLEASELPNFPLVYPYNAGIAYIISGAYEEAGVAAGNHYFKLVDGIDISILATYVDVNYNGSSDYVAFNPVGQTGSTALHLLVANTDKSKFQIFNDLAVGDTVKISATAAQVQDMGVATGHGYIRLLQGAVIKMYQKKPDASANWVTYCSESPQICFDYPSDWSVSENNEVEGYIATLTISAPTSELVIKLASGLGAGGFPEISDLSSNVNIGTLWNQNLLRIKGADFHGYVNYIAMCHGPKTCDESTFDPQCWCSGDSSNAVVDKIFETTLFVLEEEAGSIQAADVSMYFSSTPPDSELAIYDQIVLSLRATE